MAILKNTHKSHNYDKLGGVGLGIVVALDKPNSSGEILRKYAVVGAPPSPRSEPIQVIRPGNHSGNNKRRICSTHDENEEEDDYDDDDEEENFTYVTCRGPNKSITRVYNHKAEEDESRRRRRSGKAPVLKMVQEEHKHGHGWSDFLQSCDLCRKPLIGMDIYMYRGEKAFCSEECRQRQIASDERKEKLCRAEASKSSSAEILSMSPCYYERGQIFSTGIIAI